MHSLCKKCLSDSKFEIHFDAAIDWNDIFCPKRWTNTYDDAIKCWICILIQVIDATILGEPFWIAGRLQRKNWLIFLTLNGQNNVLLE